MRFAGISIGLATLVLTASVDAADVGVAANKLLVVDTLATSGKAKAAYLVKDVSVTKGSGAGISVISLRLDVAYGSGNASGVFFAPSGAWEDNSTNAKFLPNPFVVPQTQVKLALIRPGRLIKLTAAGTGDTPIDIVGAGQPAEGVYTSACVVNDCEENCHCSVFTSCSYKPLAGGAGAKLACKNGAPDPSCTARTLRPPSCFVDSGTTVVDTCSGREWEKKNTPPGGGVDPGNPHATDNSYAWAGTCSISGALCQPTPDAEAACRAQTANAVWASGGCNQCGVGEGTCDASITTVWDWLAGLNSTAFAGHSDWRLPTSTGHPLNPTGEPPELESIIDSRRCSDGCPANSFDCIDAAFDPTGQDYWAASTPAGMPTLAATVVFGFGGQSVDHPKHLTNRVRAVR
jgi:hypothetical protein